MTDAALLVTRAFRRLQAIDINEQPSESEMTHGLALMSEMVNGWQSGGLITQTYTLTGDVTADSNRITNIAEGVASVMVGHNIVGTGIPDETLVTEVLTDRSIRMSADATASAGAETLMFQFLPMPVQYEGALVAIMAVRLSEDLGKPVSALLKMAADDGWAAILAGYIPDRKAAFDRALALPAATFNIDVDVMF